MRKFYFVFAFAGLLSASCAGAPELVVNGTTDTDAEMVYLVAGKDTLATAPVVDGAFTATLPIDETNPRFINVVENGRAMGSIISEKGKVAYTKAERNVSVTGTPLNDAYQAYRDASKALNQKFQEASEDEVAAIYEEADKLENDLYENNASNFLGLYLLRSSKQYNMDADELEAALAKLDPKIAASADAQKLAEKVVLLRKTAIGQNYIEINLPDLEGNALPLSSIVGKNKYILIDFWASWCGPCMRELPYLLQAYADYKAKGFEIFGVSLDRDRDSWVNCVKDNNMNWLHVSDVKYWDCAAARDYGVNSIPANWLIDSEGKIIAKDLRGEALCAKLAELLAE